MTCALCLSETIRTSNQKFSEKLADCKQKTKRGANHPPERKAMDSLMKAISKKNAEILLRALRPYSQSYYEFKNGEDYREGNLVDSECNYLTELTVRLAEKIGLDPEAGY